MRRTLAVFMAAVPFAFGAIRAITPGWDYRYLLIALASLAGAVLGGWIVGAQRRPPSRVATLLIAFTLSLILAAVAGWLEGARSISAIVFVAGGFAVCESIACALYLWSRSRPV